MAPAMPCKRQRSIVETSAKPKIGKEKEFNTMHDCIVESQESTRQRAESLQSKNSWRSHYFKRIYFHDTLQFGA